MTRVFLPVCAFQPLPRGYRSGKMAALPQAAKTHKRVASAGPSHHGCYSAEVPVDETEAAYDGRSSTINRRVLMRLRRSLLLSAVLVAIAAMPARAAPAEVDQSKIAAALGKLGGKVEVDEKAPGKPILAVRLTFSNKLTDADLEMLKPLASLRVLDLGATKITDAGLAHLASLHGLEQLSLAGTRVTDAGLVHLEGMKGLKRLNLGKKISDAGAKHLKNLTNLEVLDLAGTALTNAGVFYLRNMTKLQVLDLSNTQITDAGLEHLKDLKELRRLFLYRTQITDAGLSHLKGFGKLKYLDLTATKTTDNAVNDLRKALPKTTIFR